MIFTTHDPKLKAALAEVCRQMPLYVSDTSLQVTVHWQEPDAPLCWQRTGDTVTLACASVHDALMLLGRAMTQRDKTTEKLTPRVAELAAMLDVSRNSVYTLPMLKRFLCQLAFLGYTACYLYMEDTYELPGYPYFGYRRGRYSVAEQKELDDFACSLGIELIPCIQTLAHLRTAIRWQYMQPMRDTVDNLMVGEPGTLALVEAMIAHFSKTFRSRRIHLGMDEAVGLGTGRYRLYKGWRDHREILLEHLNTVCGLCDKYGLQPMIWDDMLFRDHTPLMEYYGDSAPVTEEEKSQYPANLRFVYWDYYHDTQEDYEKQLRRRGCLDVTFAGGVWKWGGWAPCLSKSFQDAIAATEACCRMGVQEILVTLWGDDGDETPLATVLPGLALYGLLRFGSAVPAQTDPYCRLLGGAPLSVYESMEQLDRIPDRPDANLEALIPHKLLLYGDMASELFLPAITQDVPRLAAHYQELAAQYEKTADTVGDEHLQQILKMYQALAAVLALRCRAADRLHKAWQKRDCHGLRAACELLEQLAREAETLHTATVAVWSRECKGQGLEVLDLRLGGVSGRCRALCQRLALYMAGKLDTLTELDEPYLPYSGLLAEDGRTPAREAYGEIVTANTLCHQFSI